MPTSAIIFLTGASGAGKTALVQSLAQRRMCTIGWHFDTIGVPSEAAMITHYGSGSEWQRIMTLHWVEKLIAEYKRTRKTVVFEGQVNLDFIIAAFAHYHFTDYQIILLHCEDKIRHHRLSLHRQQPDLVNDTMDNWSHFLKRQAEENQIPILDTTHLSMEEIVAWFEHYIQALEK